MAVSDLHLLPQLGGLLRADRRIELPDLHADEFLLAVAHLFEIARICPKHVPLRVVNLDHVGRALEKNLQLGAFLSELFGPLLHLSPQPLLPPFFPVEPVPRGADPSQTHHERAQPVEPPRFVEERGDRNGELGRGFAPGPALYLRRHFERVRPRRHVRKEGLTTSAYVLPLRLETCEAIPKRNPLRIREPNARVPDLKISLVGRKAHRTIQLPRQHAVVARNGLDVHGRRRNLGRDRGRIDDRRSLLRREPKPTVAGPEPRRLHAPVCLPAPQTLFLGIRNGLDLIDLTPGKSLQFRFPDPEDALVAADPEPPPIVRENLMNGVGVEPIFLPIRRDRRDEGRVGRV